MVENIVSIDLFVDEKMEIKKNRLLPVDQKGDEQRICIVTGIHGDELEGQYVCYQLIKRINEQIKNLKGIVDIYPAVNPLGIDSISRSIPMFDIDMNRIFPGSENGAVAEYISSKIIADIKGASMCIDIHSSNIFRKEIPQVRISAPVQESLLPFAKLMNVDLIWIGAKETVQLGTLAHSLNTLGIPSMVIEMGVGMHITKNYGDQIVDGIFNLMGKLGIWAGEEIFVKNPFVATNQDIRFVHAESSGIFMPEIAHTSKIKTGALMGTIIDPLNGIIVEKITAPSDGIIITLREYPTVYRGALLARILRGNYHE